MGLSVDYKTSEEASRVTSELFSEIVTGTTESLNNSIDGNMTVGDVRVCMNMDIDGHDFICGQYAHTISGIFAWSALLMACFQIFQHLRYYSVPEQQLWIVRILFIVPIYGFCSWLGLLLPSYAIYFDVVRSCYEAFVIYSFLSLCLAYLGGETAILSQMNGKSIKRSFWAGTCCCPKMSYSIWVLRFSKQATLQFCLVKPLVALITIILELTKVLHEGDLSPRYGYVYCTLAYNVSVSLALYGLVIFYSSTRELLSPFNPVLKFLTVKAIVFMSFWQGLLLSIFHWTGLIHTSGLASAYQNFIITIEMFFAAILLHFAFSYLPYMQLRKDNQGRGVPMKNITSNFKQTLNPNDVVDDAIHNFSRVYQTYAQQGDMSEEEMDSRGTTTSFEKFSNSDEDRTPKKSPSWKDKVRSATARAPAKGFERVTLLVESDEEEIL
ncbi:transmembrane protein 184B-like [Halichondria panicea]|uniref:transmembrane protein 184B-like n=1 Tax=Halichondria panicea TaxID=6063 RepID=UPI00312B71A3